MQGKIRDENDDDDATSWFLGEKNVSNLIQWSLNKNWKLGEVWSCLVPQDQTENNILVC